MMQNFVLEIPLDCMQIQGNSINYFQHPSKQFFFAKCTINNLIALKASALKASLHTVELLLKKAPT